MTIFNMTARQDLQFAFDLMSRMLSVDNGGSSQNRDSRVLRGAVKQRTDLGLSVTLIRSSNSAPKCFCITLMVSPTSPFDTSNYHPATLGNALPQNASGKSTGLENSMAYTAG